MEEHRALAPAVWVRVPGPHPHAAEVAAAEHTERWQSLAYSVALLRRRPSRVRGFKSLPFLHSTH